MASTTAQSIATRGSEECSTSTIAKRRELVEQKFEVSLGLTAVGELLARLGLTPQKPLQRAYQRDPEAIGRNF